MQPDVTILEALNIFRKSRCHLAVICENPARSVKCMRSKEFMSHEPSVLGKS